MLNGSGMQMTMSLLARTSVGGNVILVVLEGLEWRVAFQIPASSVMQEQKRDIAV